MSLGKVWYSLAALVLLVEYIVDPKNPCHTWVNIPLLLLFLYLIFLPELAVELKVLTENGITTIVYNGKNVFKGETKGKVSGKSVNDNGTELAAAFDDDMVIWENVTGAAERIKSLK